MYYFEYKDKRYMVKGTPNLRNLDHVCEVAGFGEELWTPMGHLLKRKFTYGYFFRLFNR